MLKKEKEAKVAEGRVHAPVFPTTWEAEVGGLLYRPTS
jgi:hypothetical protein